MDVREKLVELLNEATQKLKDLCGGLNDNHGNGIRADHLIAHGVTVQGDCAELKKAMNRLGRFGRLFVDYQGCPRGRNGRAGVPLEEEVLLIPKITDVDGGEWIPVNADALHELVGQFKKLREINRQIHASVQNVPETNVGEWISVKDRLPEKRGEYLCYYKFEPDSPDVVCENTYQGSGLWLSEMDKVTHWQPMP